MLLLWLILSAVNIDAYTYTGDTRKYKIPIKRAKSLFYDDVFPPQDEYPNYYTNKPKVWRSDNNTETNLKCDEYSSKSDQFENFISVDLLTSPTNINNVYRELHVSVKAFRGVRILLSSAPEIVDPLYVIAIGEGNNKRTEIRDSVAKNTPALKTERTPGILSPFEFRHFYIRIYTDGLIEFGRIDGPPIIQYKGPLRNSLRVNFVSFASWRKLVATIQYNCPDPSLFHCDEIPDEKYDRCGNNCERLCTDFMKRGRRECEDTCNPGCRCKRGFRRDESGRCIPEYLCHNYCDQTEDFHECGILCETYCENIGPKPEVCDTENKPSKDVLQIYDCTPDCVCKPGFKRDANDQCIPEGECKSDDHSHETPDYTTSEERFEGDNNIPSIDDKPLHKDLDEYIPANVEYSSGEKYSADYDKPLEVNSPFDIENPSNDTVSAVLVLDSDEKTLLDENASVDVNIPFDENNSPSKLSENNSPAGGFILLDAKYPSDGGDFRDKDISDTNIPTNSENLPLASDLSPPDGEKLSGNPNCVNGDIPLDDNNPLNDVNEVASINEGSLERGKPSEDNSFADSGEPLHEDSSADSDIPYTSGGENSPDDYSFEDYDKNLNDNSLNDEYYLSSCVDYETRTSNFEHFISVNSLYQLRLKQNSNRKEVSFELLFHVKAYRDARILLSSTPSVAKPLYEIAIGTNKNERTELRDEFAGNVLMTVRTPGVMSPLEYRTFYIRIYKDGRVEVGALGYQPIIKYKANSSWDVKYVSFASWGRINAKFKFNCTDIDTKHYPKIDKLANYYCDRKCHEEYHQCGRQCEDKCQGVLKNKNKKVCEGPCIPGCRCMDGYRRDKYDRCIPEYKCPSLLRCPILWNEKYSKCGSICDSYCDNPSRGRCQKLSKEELAKWQKIGRIETCYPGCVCANGYMRNRFGLCVLPEKCDNHGKKPEEMKKYKNTNPTKENEKGLWDMLSDLYESIMQVVSK